MVTPSVVRHVILKMGNDIADRTNSSCRVLEVVILLGNFAVEAVTDIVYVVVVIILSLGLITRLTHFCCTREPRIALKNYIPVSASRGSFYRITLGAVWPSNEAVAR